MPILFTPEIFSALHKWDIDVSEYSAQSALCTIMQHKMCDAWIWWCALYFKFACHIYAFCFFSGVNKVQLFLLFPHSFPLMSLSVLVTSTYGRVLIIALMLNLIEMIHFRSLNNWHTWKFCMDAHGVPHQYKTWLGCDRFTVGEKRCAVCFSISDVSVGPLI